MTEVDPEKQKQIINHKSWALMTSDSKTYPNEIFRNFEYRCIFGDFSWDLSDRL